MLARLFLAFLMVNSIGAEQRADRFACAADQHDHAQLQSWVVETVTQDSLADTLDTDDGHVATVAETTPWLAHANSPEVTPRCTYCSYQQPQARAPPASSNA